MLSALAESGQDPIEFFARGQKYHGSGEINSVVADPDAALERFGVAARAQEFGPGTVEEFDGVSLEGPDFWCNVRKSNTEPLVRFNCETPSAERTARLAEAVLQRVRREP